MLKRVPVWGFSQAQAPTPTCSETGGWENENWGSLLFVALQDSPLLRSQECTGRWVSAPTSRAVGWLRAVAPFPLSLAAAAVAEAPASGAHRTRDLGTAGRARQGPCCCVWPWLALQHCTGAGCGAAPGLAAVLHWGWLWDCTGAG